MARPQVADGGDGLQLWRVAANILNEQSRTANKGLSSLWCVRGGVDILSSHVTKCCIGSLTYWAPVNAAVSIRVLKGGYF
jgi:hypothetical protein